MDLLDALIETLGYELYPADYFIFGSLSKSKI